MNLLLFLTLSFCFIGGILSCSCFNPSGISVFKRSYCHADFVIKAKVLSGKIPVNPANQWSDVYYNIKTKRHFKNYVSNFGYMIKPLFTRVYTASHSAACGVDLQQGEMYLLMGRYDGTRLRIASCSFNRMWHAVKKCDKRWMRRRPSCSWSNCPNPGGLTAPSQQVGPIKLEAINAEPIQAEPDPDEF